VALGSPAHLVEDLASVKISRSRPAQEPICRVLALAPRIFNAVSLAVAQILLARSLLAPLPAPLAVRLVSVRTSPALAQAVNTMLGIAPDPQAFNAVSRAEFLLVLVSLLLALVLRCLQALARSE